LVIEVDGEGEIPVAGKFTVVEVGFIVKNIFRIIRNAGAGSAREGSVCSVDGVVEIRRVRRRSGVDAHGRRDDPRVQKASGTGSRKDEGFASDMHGVLATGKSDEKDNEKEGEDVAHGRNVIDGTMKRDSRTGLIVRRDTRARPPR
jgi:hypothetical protein